MNASIDCLIDGESNLIIVLHGLESKLCEIQTIVTKERCIIENNTI